MLGGKGLSAMVEWNVKLLYFLGCVPGSFRMYCVIIITITYATEPFLSVLHMLAILSFSTKGGKIHGGVPRC